jgi:hypothetical protein
MAGRLSQKDRTAREACGGGTVNEEKFMEAVKMMENKVKEFEKKDIPADTLFLPCPFCGGKDIPAFLDNQFCGEDNIGFYCRNCETLFETKFDGIKDAINYCWNNRSG